MKKPLKGQFAKNIKFLYNFLVAKDVTPSCFAFFFAVCAIKLCNHFSECLNVLKMTVEKILVCLKCYTAEAYFHSDLVLQGYN